MPTATINVGSVLMVWCVQGVYVLNTNPRY